MSYWKLQADLMDARREGREEGILIGEKHGEEKMNELIKQLLKDNRIEDIKKIVSDDSFRKAMLKQYGVAEASEEGYRVS